MYQDDPAYAIAVDDSERARRLERLSEIETQIAECQRTIDGNIAELERIREIIPRLLHDAEGALDKRNSLIVTIETERLWDLDYESVEDYMDAHHFSRQRAKQIKDRVRIMSLVNEVDKHLPPPTDRQTRILTTLPTDELIGKVFRRAVQDSDGAPPPLSRIEFLSDAAAEGVDVDDDDALKLYKEQQIVDEIVRLWKQLSEEGQALVMTLI